MKNVLACVQTIVHLAKQGNEVSQQKKEASGIDNLGMDAYSSAGIARRRGSNIGDDNLQQFLSELDLQTLQRLQALMYSGRDKQPAQVLKKEFQSRNETSTDIVRTIMEKRINLETYFNQALEQAKKDGLSIDSF